MVLALDASTLSCRFTLLVVSVVYGGCGIPVAWKVIEAKAKGSWQPYWLDLLSHLTNTIPQDWLVLVMADRGLYAKWLYEAIQQQGWHPFLRINQLRQFHPVGQPSFVPLTTVVTQNGQSWSGRVTCFSSNPLSCTLLARWDSGYSDPWLIVTDLDPDQAEGLWYRMRSWIECLFKDTKRGGWQWHQTKMTDPQRAERHWLAIAIATRWVVSVGGESDADLSSNDSQQLPATPVESQNSDTGTPKPRILSCFRRGKLADSCCCTQSSSVTYRSIFSRFFSKYSFSLLSLNLKNLPLKAYYGGEFSCLYFRTIIRAVGHGFNLLFDSS
nr:transposase [Moorena sp. SIO4E2]